VVALMVHAWVEWVVVTRLQGSFFWLMIRGCPVWKLTIPESSQPPSTLPRPPLCISDRPRRCRGTFRPGTALRQAGRAAEGKQEQKILVDLQEKRRTAAIKKTESQW